MADGKPGRSKKQEKNRDIIRLDEVVLLSKQGDKKATEELIQLVTPYLKKYVSILKGAKVTLSNPDTYKFYSLFLPGQEKSVTNIAKVQKLLVVFGASYIEDELFN